MNALISMKGYHEKFQESPLVDICAHCGVELGINRFKKKNTFRDAEKASEILKLQFCCQGCEHVHSILRQQGLLEFYSIDEKAGLFSGNYFREQGPTIDYSILDTQEYAKNFIIHAGDVFESSSINMKPRQVVFILHSIHCAACVWLLEKLPKFHPEILFARINYLRKEIKITYNPAPEDESSIGVKLSEIAKLLEELGYPPDLSHSHLGLGKKILKDVKGRYKKVSSEHSDLIRVGVSGFCFGNIMLFSFPEYIDNNLAIYFAQGFRNLNFLLSLPVFFYCAYPYFQSFFIWIRMIYKTKKLYNFWHFNLDLPIVLGILCMYGCSIYEWVTSRGAGYFDSFVGLIFFLSIGRLITSKSFKHLQFERNYSSFFPLSVKRVQCLTDTQEAFVPVKDLNRGDIIELRYAEIVPTDIILFSEETKVDLSFITGEEAEVVYKKGASILAGAKILGPAILGVVDAVLASSSLGKLWELSDRNERDKQIDGANITSPAFQVTIQKITPYFTFTILLLALSSFFYWLPDVGRSLRSLSGVLIIACPCALSMVTPFTLGTAMNILGRLGFFVKNIEVIEKFSILKHIVFDKTGTLSSRKEYEVKFRHLLDSHLSVSQDNEVFFKVDVCRELYLIFRESTHPHSLAIARYIKEKIQELYGENFLPSWIEKQKKFHDFQNFKNYPGKGYRLEYKQNVYTIGQFSFLKHEGLFHDNVLDEESLIFQDGTDNDITTSSIVWLARNDKVLGSFLLEVKPRKGVQEMLNNLSCLTSPRGGVGNFFAKEITLHLLSGDKKTAQHPYQKYFMKENQYFEKNPIEKVKIIEMLSSKGPVLMIGDGLNDAGAFIKASLGIALTENTSHFTPASDVIMQADLLSKFDKIFNFLLSVRFVIYICLALSFAYNVFGLTFALQGNLNPLFTAIIMPLSSVSVIIVSASLIKLISFFYGLGVRK